MANCWLSWTAAPRATGYVLIGLGLAVSLSGDPLNSVMLVVSGWFLGSAARGLDRRAAVRWITYQQFWLLTHPTVLCDDDETLVDYVREFVVAALLEAPVPV